MTRLLSFSIPADVAPGIARVVFEHHDGAHSTFTLAEGEIDRVLARAAGEPFTVPGPVDAGDVLALLEQSYPPEVLGWVPEATWRFDHSVPLAHVNMRARPGGRDPEKVAGIAAAIEGGADLGPVVLVETSEGLDVADGYHRTLATKQVGRPTIAAVIAEGAGDHGPWETEMHAAKLNRSGAEVAELARVDIIRSLAERADDDSMHFTLGVAYPAYREDDPDRGDRDGHGTFMDVAELETVAWHWMAVHRAVGVAHADGTEGHCVPVESYIYRGPDWSVALPDGTSFLVKAGDWLVGAIWDDPGWGLVQQNLIRGWSIQGQALEVKTAE